MVMGAAGASSPDEVQASAGAGVQADATCGELVPLDREQQLEVLRDEVNVVSGELAKVADAVADVRGEIISLVGSLTNCLAKRGVDVSALDAVLAREILDPS